MVRRRFLPLLILLLPACTPAASTPIANPTLTPFIITTPTIAQTEIPLLVPPFPVPAGGFSLSLPQTYYVDPIIPPMTEDWHDPRSILLAAADYAPEGPFIRLGGGSLTPPLTSDDLMAYLRQDRAAFGYELGDVQFVGTEAGLSGSSFNFTFPVKDSTGTGQVMLFTSATQYVFLMAAAPDERWAELAAGLDGVVDSLAFIPIEPAKPRIETVTYLPDGAVPPLPYHLGHSSLSLPDDLAADLPARLSERPAELKGIISLPDGDGPFPLALILHGRDKTICQTHLTQVVSPWLDTTFCPPGTSEVRYDIGFAALAARLAEQGIVALSIDVNEGYLVSQDDFDIFNDPAYTLDLHFVPLIARQHLQALVEANNGGVQPFGADLTGKLDLSRVLLFGHSRGGQNALVLSGITPGVIGLLMIAPANEYKHNVPADIPFAVLTPSCDGDLADWQGQGLFERAIGDPARTQPGASAMLGFANHNYFNGLLAMKNDSPRKLDNEDCTQTDNILPQNESQAFLLEYAAAFASAAISENPQAAFPPFDPSAPVSNQRFAVPVLESLLLPPDQRAILLGPEPLRLPGVLPSLIRLERMDCPQGATCHPILGKGEINLPGNPAVTRLAWDSPDAALQFTFSPQPFNASGYDHLSLRLALDLTDERNRSTETGVVIQFRDDEGGLAEMTLNTPAPFHTLPSPYYGWGGIPIQLSSLRVPLTNVQDADLSALASLTIGFPAESGALYLADLEFLKTSTGE